MDPSKIKAITQWLQLVDGKKMQHFMEVANFHYKFSYEFARIAVSLDECYSNKKIAWTLSTFKLSRNLRICS
jgi:hypothetical protein